MFSGFELTVIKSWAAEGKDILAEHLQCPIFTPAEKEDKRREYAALESIIEEAKRIQTEYVCLDADHLCYMMAVLDEYKNYEKDLLDRAELSTEDYAVVCYQIGYMQGRMELGLLSASDVEVIQDWEIEMQD